MSRPDPGPDTREELAAEVALLARAQAILVSRFRTGKHDLTADQVRRAAAELAARARHPSRRPLPERDPGAPLRLADD